MCGLLRLTPIFAEKLWHAGEAELMLGIALCLIFRKHSTFGLDNESDERKESRKKTVSCRPYISKAYAPEEKKERKSKKHDGVVRKSIAISGDVKFLECIV